MRGACLRRGPACGSTSPMPGASVLKIGSRCSNVVRLAADHQAVAALEAPHAAAGAGIHVMNALRPAAASARRTSSLKYELPPSMRVSPGSNSSASLFTMVSVGVARRHHQPGRARLLQQLDEILRDRSRPSCLLFRVPRPSPHPDRTPPLVPATASGAAPCSRPSGPDPPFRVASSSSSVMAVSKFRQRRPLRSRRKMHAQGAPLAFGKHIEISARLRRLHNPERELLPGNRRRPAHRRR